MKPLKLGENSVAPHGSMLIHGLTVIAQPNTIINDGAILIGGGDIREIGPSVVLRARHPQTLAIDASGYTAIPGLINAHTHVAMGFFRGLGHGQDEMIEKFFFPAEKSLTPELLAPLSFSYIYGGLTAGVTCFGDHYYFSDGVAQAFERLGVRAVVGETIADLGGAFPGRASWERWQQKLSQWSYSSRVTPAIAPHAADTVSGPLLKELADYARHHQLPLHMHLSQTKGEYQRVAAREGCSPVEFADRCGALSERTLAVHLVSSTPSDHAILQRRGTTAVICPASQIIYERLAPLADLIKASIPLALATDAAASNDTADLLAEMRLAALLAQDRGLPLEQRLPEDFFQMTTLNPARALCLEARIGSLAVGKAADIVFLAEDLSTQPETKPMVNLIFSQSSRNVRHVMIDGRFVLYNSRLTLASEDDLLAEFRAAASVIHARLKAAHSS